MRGVNQQEGGLATSVFEDEAELRRLVSVYCSVVDDGDAHGMAELFVPNGQLVVFAPGLAPGVDAPLRCWQGVDGFSKLIAALGLSYTRWVHFVGNHWATVEGDLARGETYCMASHLRETPDGSAEEVNLIRYRDVFARTPSGWRFETRNAIKQWGTVRPVNATLHELDAVLQGREL